MSSEQQDLIAALESAVAADESNVVLRAHLARLLSDAGRHADTVPDTADELLDRWSGNEP